MPIPENLRDVFEMVSKATDDGRARWKPGPFPGMFFLALEDFSVQLWSKIKRGTLGPDSQVEEIVMNLLDSNGERFQGFALDFNDSDFKNLATLINKAAQAAKNRADERLSKFKQQLAEKLGA